MLHTVFVQLFPQPSDMYRQGIVINKFTVLIPETVQNLIPGHHSVAVDLQVMDQPPFCGSQGFRKLVFPLCPADQGVNPGDQLPQPEGLGDIVIRTQFQTMYNICFVIPGCQEDYRAVFPLPQSFAKIKAAAVRQGHIQYNEIHAFTALFCFIRINNGQFPKVTLFR